MPKVNLCVSLVGKAKLDYHNKRNHKKVSDNKTFWKFVNPFFTDKGVSHNKILLACWLKKMRPFQIMMKYLKN